MDEAVIKQSASITFSWYPKGKKAIVMSPVTHDKLNITGAVKLSTGQVMLDYFEKFNKEGFIQFIDVIDRNEPETCKKIYIILDNATPHRANAVREYLDSNPYNRIELLFLPAYSPELNPAENIWLQLRREKTHNAFFPTIMALFEAVESFEVSYMFPNPVMKSLCAYY